MAGPGKIYGGKNGRKALRFQIDDPQQLREQVDNHLRQLGVSAKNIDRLIKHSNVLDAFREVYKGSGPNAIANIEVKQVYGKTIVNLTLKEKFTFCSQKRDFDIRKCTSSSYVTFRDSYVLKDEASTITETKISGLQKKRLPAIARSRKKKAARRAKNAAKKVVKMTHQASPSEDKFSLINNNSLALLENRNSRLENKLNDEWANTPFKEIQGSRKILVNGDDGNSCSSNCKPDPVCYENGNIYGKPRMDLVRKGICRFCVI